MKRLSLILFILLAAAGFVAAGGKAGEGPAPAEYPNQEFQIQPC